MFSIIRLIFGCIFFGGIFIILRKKSTVTRRRIIYLICLTVIVISVLSLLPIENLFMRFDTPEAAFRYFHLGKNNIELVVEGNDSAFVIDYQNNTNTYQIIPKDDNKWKVGIGLYLKTVVHMFSDGLAVYVYQYKNTDDYYINIFDINGVESNISDNCHSQFYSLIHRNDLNGSDFVSYYAHIAEYNSQYYVVVNGKRIEMAIRGQ